MVRITDVMDWKKAIGHRAVEMNCPPCTELRVQPELYRELEGIIAPYMTARTTATEASLPQGVMIWEGVRIIRDWYGLASLSDMPGAK